ncbi:Hsp20/alpha crystallin family protein [Pontibacter oryzae]|uniref:Hsp20/alpha crystallin family protein n=1 Tax=Pontibacter oryzae TaxID=2304593 RepID=A0A399S2P8_9BACT|nr:Hsp20/alpha crystallin family protein [Pontibacter oryzae]RIJ37561.1 Hsp20/alpha crystallin family protein [Pontibacter oryzae]
MKEKDMKLIKDKEFLRNIAYQIDLMNTLGGGVSETYVNIKKYKRGAVISISAASVRPDLFKVVLNNNQLTLLSVLQSELSAEIAAPMFNRTFILPPQVDLGRIEAVHENGELQVRLPYYESTGKPREIEIKEL